jgi:hypothetical protein
MFLHRADGRDELDRRYELDFSYFGPGSTSNGMLVGAKGASPNADELDTSHEISLTSCRPASLSFWIRLAHYCPKLRN